MLLIITSLVSGCGGGSSSSSSGGSSSSGSSSSGGGGTPSPSLSPSPSPVPSIVTSDAVYCAPTADRKYSYYYYIPASALTRKSGGPIRVLLYTHGGPTDNNDNSYARWENYVRNNEVPRIKPYCDTYGYALIIVVTPRYGSTLWPYYTMGSQSMLRWVMFNNDFDSQIPNFSFYKKPDLVFVKAIDEFISYLKNNGYTPYEKVFITGFSSGGMQANRFSILFPNKVAASSIGAAGLFTYPLDTYNSTNLIYAVGTYDISQISGNTYSLSSYKNIPHFVFTGGDDTNDPINGSNSATNEEKDIIRNNSNFFGSNPVERAEKFSSYLQSIDMQSTYKSYSGVGHSYTPDMLKDTFTFFNSVTTQ